MTYEEAANRVILQANASQSESVARFENQEIEFSRKMQRTANTHNSVNTVSKATAKTSTSAGVAPIISNRS